MTQLASNQATTRVHHDETYVCSKCYRRQRKQGQLICQTIGCGKKFLNGEAGGRIVPQDEIEEKAPALVRAQA